MGSNFNIPVDLYDECFYVTGILSFWILLPSCVLFVSLSLSFTEGHRDKETKRGHVDKMEEEEGNPER